jgi:hypothetical protein
MIFSASITERKLVCPQFEHTLPAGEEPFAIGKYFRPALTLTAADFAFHEGWI